MKEEMRHFRTFKESTFDHYFNPTKIKFLQECAHLRGLDELLVDYLGADGLLRDHNLVAAFLGCRED